MSAASRHIAGDSGRRLRPTLNRRSVIVFVLACGVLLAPWPGYGRAAGAAFSVWANGIVGVLGVGAPANQLFSPLTPAEASVHGDWAVWLSRRDLPPGESPKAAIDTRILAYTPVALFLALWLATSLPRRRKLVHLGVGLSVVLARLALAILLAPGPVARIAWLVLVSPPVMTYATPLLAWGGALAVTTPDRRPRQSHISRRGHKLSQDAQ